jgi:flagellar capping protein FliD
MAARRSNLVGYDPAGTQNLQQTVAAQNSQLTVNNIAIQSTSNTVSDAVAGVTMTLAQTGTSSVSVQRDTSSIVTGIQDSSPRTTTCRAPLPRCPHMTPAHRRLR